MKKIIGLVVIITVIIGCYSAVLPASSATADTVPTALSVTPVQTGRVLESRFLNMLNHNFVYDTSFDTVDSLVNESILAILHLRDTVDDSYISTACVSDFVYSMYGIVPAQLTELDAELLTREGYIAIIPRCFNRYNHKNPRLARNEDGSYTVTTTVVVETLDGEYTFTAVSLFVENSLSDFGYNIICSNLYQNIQSA